MKKVLYLLFLLAVAIFSCSKSTEKIASNSPDPSIEKVSFYRAYAGSNVSVGFAVDLISDSVSVDKVSLYMLPGYLRWEVQNPKTGRYIMYDHVGDYPTYTQNVFYYFEFHKRDGKTVKTTPFQVY